MDISKYGPFATTIAVSAALVAVFSVLLLKSVGKVSQWTWLVHDSPSFLVTAGARAIAFVLIATTFIFMDSTNYKWFVGAALIFGIATFVLIVYFDRLRKEHLCKVPILNADGSQAKTFWRQPRFEMLVIGSKKEMNSVAKKAYKGAGAVSLCKFMSGFGSNGVNDPAAIWDMAALARISNRMTMTLMGIFLCAVMWPLFTASLIEVHQRPATTTQTSS